MNQSTPASIQKKIQFLMNTLDQIYKKVTNKENHDSQQLSRIKFIALLDEFIDKVQILKQSDMQNYSSGQQIKNYKQSSTNNEQSQKIIQLSRQKIQLQKKLIEYRQKQIKKQQYTLELQKTQVQNIKKKSELQKEISQLNKTIKQLKKQIEYHSEKNNHQEQQMQRLIRLNQKQMDQLDKVKQQRNRAEKRQYQLRQKYQNNEQLDCRLNSKIQRFNVKNTQGLKNVRIVTNISQQKKNHQKYFLLQLPVKLQIQKIVYGIRMGVVLQNKQLFYFNQLFLYQKDTMNVSLEGDKLAIDYIKRKQRVVLDKYRVTKPQILILLYGKGDSVLVDQTKEK